jgi:hypothetical protein
LIQKYRTARVSEMEPEAVGVAGPTDNRQRLNPRS